LYRCIIITETTADSYRHMHLQNYLFLKCLQNKTSVIFLKGEFMQKELISVIVPVYKVEKYLHKCLDSILNQTYKNLEIILVDDGSPDRCGEICDEYAKKDARVRVIHKQNGGVSDARNAGLEIAAGEYIGFVDGDDYIDENMYRAMYDAVKKDESDIAICGLLSVDENANEIKKNNLNIPIEDGCFDKEYIFKQFCINKYWHYVTVWNKLYKKELFSVIKFPVGKIHEDELVAHHIVGKCSRISCISKPLYFYVKRSDSITNKPFSEQRLDGAEAFLDRATYMKAYGMDEVVANSLLRAIYIMRRVSHKKVVCSEDVKKRIWTLTEEVRKMCSCKMSGLLQWKGQVHMLLFKLSPFVYYKITGWLKK